MLTTTQLYLTNPDTFNSLTKYPSILTYHPMGHKGILDPTPQFDLSNQNLIATEKVDGTNVRIIVAPDTSFCIGSREELLYMHGDCLYLPSLNIVQSLVSLSATNSAHTTEPNLSDPSNGSQGTLLRSIRSTACLNHITVLYGELYGGNIGKAARNYTDSKDIYGFRLFDMWRMPITSFEEKLKLSPEQASSWREDNNQPFLNESSLQTISKEHNIELTHRINTAPVPSSIVEVNQWLHEHIPHSFLSSKKAEGIVIRTHDRKIITKIRFEDYQRTLKRMK